MKKLVLITISSLWAIGLFGASIGQRFILSCPKSNDKEFLKSWMEKTKPAGVMLEAWHMRDRKETKKFTQMLQEIAQEVKIPPLLISIDWEGGIVSRANETGGFSSVPAPYKLAKAGRGACYLAGKLIGQQLRSVGINIDFAPSLDLFSPDNYVLGTRCFSADPKKVLECGVAFAQGLLSVGILPVIKHFPGLGLGNGDTHLADVKIDFKNQDFENHSYPFVNALDAGLPAVMVSHAVYQDFENKPASQSSVAVNFLKKNNPEILLITDDIFMPAFNNKRKEVGDQSFVDDIMGSLKAGFNLLIFSESPKNQCKLIETLNALDACGKLKNHVHTVKKQREFTARVFNQENYIKSEFDEVALSKRLARAIVTPCAAIEDLTQKKVLMISVNLTKIRPGENWFINQKNSYTGLLLKKQIKQFDEIILDPKEVKTILQAVKIEAYDVVMLQTFFYGQGLWNEHQEAWLKELIPLSDKLVVFSLGHPYEQKILGNRARIIELGAFCKPELEVACERLTAAPFQTGADRFMDKPESYLKNKKFALLCHGGSYVAYYGKEYFLPDALVVWAKRQGDQSHLVALFSPEHGLLGDHEAYALVASEEKTKWGCPVYSLHGDVLKPTDQMLEGVDVLLIDLQDIGVRCYTYISTMVMALEIAAKKNIEVILLDRPNPIKFLGAHGPDLEKTCESFLGKINIPFMHGETIGALAKLANEKHQAKLTVIDCVGDEACYFETKFKKPSPNIMSLDTIYTYPMTVFIEGTNYSEGRGTFNPFEQIGAPWVDAQTLADTLNKKHLAGVYFEPRVFTPNPIAGVDENPKHKGQKCGGVFIHILDLKKVAPVKIGRVLLDVLFSLYPQESKFLPSGKRYALDLRVGNTTWREEIKPGV